MQNSRARNAALLLGVGLGGFLDGIVLHQIVHWHNMLSARVPPVTLQAARINMAADGWFHLAMWLVTLAGVLLLWSSSRERRPLPPTRAFAGYLFVGWGSFNLVEGIIDHHVLELHHVRDLPQHLPWYDWAFLLGAGIGFIVLGAWLCSGSRQRRFATERRSGPDRRASAA
jgi:uncharacterized membrane protein